MITGIELRHNADRNYVSNKPAYQALLMNNKLFEECA